MFLNASNTPRWLIFLIDLGVVIFSVLFAYLLRFNFSIPPVEMKPLPGILAYILIIRAATFILSRSYAGIIRYTSTRDALRVIVTIFSGSVVFGITNLVTFYLINRTFFIPFSIIIIDLLITTMAMISFRMIVKIAYLEFQNPDRVKVNVVIYGAGEAGITAKRVLDRDSQTRYKVLAFIEESSGNAGKKLEGIDIVSPDRLDALLASGSVEEVILAVHSIGQQKKEEIVDKCLGYNIKVLTVPPMIQWVNGELSFKQIRTINIEELLERPEIRLDVQQIREQITGKTILITGAAGSIGSEIARQVARFFPAKLVLLDQAETALHDLKLGFLESFPETDTEFIIADICNESRIDAIFRHFRPQILYHAAAYKHVPMMEGNPVEAIITNVGGTRLIADMAVKYSVSHFIMISTDKAVNPTSVMGASKRIAEIYVQSLTAQTDTKFITTRFGNVLGSSGSVIPLFRSQIERGGPVTITHPEITRFFMTIPEACQLVLEAGAIGNGGEIFIFDMGQSVRIADLARKMIKLSGLTAGKDIEIRYTGLRPGEKLFEELLNKEENTLPTHHPLIMIAKVASYDPVIVSEEISSLAGMVKTGNNYELVKQMKVIVPEYKSQNSVFEQLD